MNGFDLDDDIPSLHEEFQGHFGRSLEEPAEQVVLNEGNPNCQHPRVFYEDIPFDGQAWRCDTPGCGRHERMDYSPGFKMKFPAGALISTPNTQYGAEAFYACRADDKGLAQRLDRKDWVKRER